jgi:N-acylneuraminate cytidylyltransferase
MMNIPPIKALIFMKEHSERVPDKNIRHLCGRPLFYWILDSLSHSQYIKEIIINTDSEEIAEDASKNFKVTIHMRPDYLLHIQSDEAYQIMAYDLEKIDGEFFIQSHSTNPLLRSETIDKAVESFFKQNECDSLFSVTPVQKRFFQKDASAINHDPEKLIKTQELPIIFEENSCIYLFSRTVFFDRKNRLGHQPMLFPIDRFEAVDIDEEFDFAIAEALMAARLKAKGNI